METQYLKIGTKLQNGKYTIIDVLGQGGFGITYKAMMKETASGKLGAIEIDVPVAIKEFFMTESCMRDESNSHVTIPSTGSKATVEQYRRKFVKEANNLAGLSHPNIVKVIDVFNENSTDYYVMEYLEGGSLKDLVKKNGKLDEQTAIQYINQIGNALSYMHTQKYMCHYDVKPGNILLDKNGVSKLIDFGISKNYDVHGNQTSSTPVGISKGFAPLEQYQQSVQELSPQTDVYELGATLYYLLTGTVPPEASLVFNNGLPDLPQSISEKTREAVNQAMQPRKKDRPQTMEKFLSMVEHIKEPVYDDDSTIIKTELSKIEHQTMAYDKKTSTWKKIGVIAGALVIGLLIGYFMNGIVKPGVSKKTISFNTGSARVDSILQNMVDNMVRVEGGTFTMGATSEQGSDAYDREKPAHQVTLSAFSIGKYEVTQEEWEAVMGNNPSNFKGAKRPVEQVSWNDCQDFINKLNSLTGMNFRLPTEAEWEFAARGGTTSNGYKYAGDNSLSNVAWYDDNSGSTTHDVGQKSPNELGLYDMSGNVWEWCQDWYGSYSSSSQIDPKGASSGSGRVYRGGSWCHYARDCRVSDRFSLAPSYQFNYLGFRLAL